MATSIVDHNEEVETMRKATRVTKSGRLLVEAGLSFDDFQSVIDDPIKRQNLVRYWRAGYYAPLGTCTYNEAEDIMRNNFLGLAHVISLYRAICPQIGFAEVADIPYPEITLQESKDTHVLMLGIPVTIEQISTVAGKLRIRTHDELVKYDPELVCVKQTLVRPGWHLISKESLNVFPEDRAVQDAYVQSNEVRPSAAEMVYLITLYFLANEQQLYFRELIGCSDQLTEGHAAVSSIPNIIDVAQTTSHSGAPRLVKEIRPAGWQAHTTKLAT